MSVIQRIQEKYAKLMAIIIAVALIIFVVMLAFENGGRLFSGRSTTVGKVNGKAIDITGFQRKVSDRESQMQQQGFYGTGPAVSEQALNAVWNQEVNRALLNSELNKLGIQVGKKEMGDILYGPNAPEDLKKSFTDPNTGIYNGRMAKQQIDQMLKIKTGTDQQLQQRDQLIAYIESLEEQRLNDKYNSLFANSANVPRWLVEKQNADNSLMAKISFVRDFYSTNPDSTIKITDKEIEDYIDKHKKDFKQEESRSIAYVAFSALPAAADSAAAMQRLLDVKAEFDSTHKVQEFLSRIGTVTPYADIYVAKSKMQMQNKDTLQKIPINGVFGPYIDGNTYTLAKMIDIKNLPDSVKCRHILLGTVDRQGQPIMPDSVAKRKVDSIELAIKNGANFDTLETKYSTDEVAHKDKGEMTFSSYDIQGENFAKEFGQFILFDGKPGDKKAIKTSFGWHYIEILKFINVEPHYKIAFMAKRIETSPETEANASNEASLFAGDSRDQKSFDANAEKLKAKGINKNIAIDILPNSYVVQGLGAKRSFVKSVYKAKLGDVLEPEKVGDKYVVAILTEINEEGTMPVAKARLQVEPILKNKKVAEKLKQKVGKVTTLEAAAAALGGKPVETADSLRLSGSQARSAMIVAGEPKVIGASFNPANRGKVVPEVIEGSSGIYVVRIDNVTTTPLGEANVPQQRKAQYEQKKQQEQYSSPLQALRQAAKIKDRRTEFF